MAVLMHKKRHFANLEICDSFWKRFMGLMFRKKLGNGNALLFILPKESRMESSIHMMFVFFPIDVLWLDKNFKVIDKRLNIKPFSFNHTPKESAKYVVEAAAGKFSSLELEEKLSINF